MMTNLKPKSTPAALASALLAMLTSLLIGPAVLAAEDPEQAAESSGAKAQYVKFHPDFIVNLKSTEPHFLMVTVQGMSREPEGIAAAKHHMAAIRHHILMLLSEQTMQSVSSVEAKQQLMDEALGRIQEFLVAETGRPGIDAVYFTDFVVE